MPGGEFTPDKRQGLTDTSGHVLDDVKTGRLSRSRRRTGRIGIEPPRRIAEVAAARHHGGERVAWIVTFWSHGWSRTTARQAPRDEEYASSRANSLECGAARNVHGTIRAARDAMEMLTVMVALLVAALFVMPAWPYSARWGYCPAGSCGMVALLVAALVLVGRL